MLQSEKKKLVTALEEDFPEQADEADCLYREIVSRNGIAEMIKVGVIEANTVLSETEKTIQLEAANKDLKELADQVKIVCEVDGNKLNESVRRK